MSNADAVLHTQHLLEAALAAVVRGASSEARRIAAAAVALANACGAHHAAANAHSFLARLDHSAAEFESARAHFADAVAALRRAGDEREVLRVELSVAFTIYDQGDGARASEIIDDVETRAFACRAISTLRPLIVGYRGNIARQRGDLAKARACYQEAVDAAAAAEDRTFARVFAMDDAVARLLADESAPALTQLLEVQRETRALVHGLQRLFTIAIVAHYVAIARLLIGAPEAAHTDGAPVLPSLQSIHDVVACGAPRPSLSALQTLPQQTEHARLSARLLLRLTESSSSTAPRVLVALDGTKLVRGSVVVDLSRRVSLRRIVAALAGTLADGRHSSLSTKSLIEAGWPGEKLLASAARNRLHVALNTLRRLGLDIALRQTDNGYALDGDRTVVVGRLE